MTAYHQVGHNPVCITFINKKQNDEPLGMSLLYYATFNLITGYIKLILHCKLVRCEAIVPVNLSMPVSAVRAISSRLGTIGSLQNYSLIDSGFANRFYIL